VFHIKLQVHLRFSSFFRFVYTKSGPKFVYTSYKQIRARQEVRQRGHESNRDKDTQSERARDKINNYNKRKWEKNYTLGTETEAS